MLKHLYNPSQPRNVWTPTKVKVRCSGSLEIFCGKKYLCKECRNKEKLQFFFMAVGTLNQVHCPRFLFRVEMGHQNPYCMPNFQNVSHYVGWSAPPTTFFKRTPNGPILVNERELCYASWPETRGRGEGALPLHLFSVEYVSKNPVLFGNGLLEHIFARPFFKIFPTTWDESISNYIPFLKHQLGPQLVYDREGPVLVCTQLFLNTKEHRRLFCW